MLGKIKLWILISGVLSLGLWANPGLAEETAAFDLEEIVVTATRTEKKPIEVPASVSVVTREEIKERRVLSVDEALRIEVGCNTLRGKGLMDGMAQLTLRGFEGQERTLVMVDGQPLNGGYSGSVQWSSIPLEEIERIEVVRGPFSSLYGGNAMGGVINIITKTPKQRELDYKSSYGTYDTYTYHASYRDKLGILGFSLAYDKKHTNGYTTEFYTKTAKDGKKGIGVTGWEKTKDSGGNTVYLVGDKGRNGAEDEGFSAKLNLDLTPNSLLALGIISSQYRWWHEMGRSYLEDSAGDEVNNGKVWIDDDGDQRYFEIYPGNFLRGPGNRAGNIYTAKFESQFNEHLRLKLGGGLTDMVKDWYITPTYNKATEDGGRGELTTTPSQGILTEVQIDIENLIERNILTIGTGYKHDHAESEVWELSDWRDEGDTTDLLYVAGGKTSAHSFYLQDEIGLMEDSTKNLTLFLGARYDLWKTYEGMNDDLEYDPRQKDCLSPKASAIFNYLPTSTTLRLSGGKAFRPPTIYELYKTWSVGGKTYESNPDLRPEETVSWETGIEQGLFGNRLKMKVAYFESHISELIYTITDATDPNLKKKLNAAKGETKGVEIEVDHKFNKYISAFANLSYTDPKITENPDLPETEGKQVTYVPSEIHSFGINLSAGGVKGGISGQYIGKRYGEDDNRDVEEGVYGSYDSHFVMDTGWSYEVVPEFEISFGINNIFDREYYESSKAPRRTYTLGLEARFF